MTGTNWQDVINRLMRAGYTQTKLAGECGIKPQSISYLASGKATDPGYSVGSRLLEILATVPTPAAPAATTHQEIVDATERLHPQYLATYNAAKAELDAQRAEIQRQCGAIGHVYGRGAAWAGLMYHSGRACLFCHAAEPDMEG